MDPTKKISFGFKKSKKLSVISSRANEQKPENDKQLIQCLEENSIKLVNKNEIAGIPLVIPVQQNRTSAALASLKLRRAILSGNLGDERNSSVKPESEETDTTNPPVTVMEGDAGESLEKRAARELLDEIRNTKNTEDKADTQVAVPLKPDELPLDGAEEPNIEDYEKIPISQFGLAMLRGMGWKDELKNDDKFGGDQPIQRPKGMGLGADKVLKVKPLLVAPEKNEKLEIKKNAYVRILGGKHKDLYGLIEGLDDHSGRVIIKLAVGGGKESMNEFLIQPVSKGEYTKYGKVINSAKYDEYKNKQESAKSQIKHEKIKIEHEIQIKIELGDVKNEIKVEKSNKYYDESSSSNRTNETIETNRSQLHRKDQRESEGKYRSREGERTHEKYNRRDECTREGSVTSEDSTDYHHRRSKKKSSKSKKEKSKDRNRKYYSASSEENDKRHKKKTKKSKKEKARSRSRGRR